jgi:hypothetical protein
MPSRSSWRSSRNSVAVSGVSFTGGSFSGVSFTGGSGPNVTL